MSNSITVRLTVPAGGSGVSALSACVEQAGGLVTAVVLMFLGERIGRAVPLAVLLVAGGALKLVAAVTTDPTVYTIALIAWKWTAFTGARVSGWTAANQRGSNATRPMAKSDRVAAMAPAFAFASELLRMAKTMSKPPIPGSTSSAMNPHGSPPLKV